MGLNNLEEVKTSLPNVQSMGMQILEEQNDAAKVQHLNPQRM